MAEAKINFDKIEGLRLGAWRSGVPLPGPFHWSDGPICILGVWFGAPTGAKLVGSTGRKRATRSVQSERELRVDQEA